MSKKKNRKKNPQGFLGISPQVWGGVIIGGTLLIMLKQNTQLDADIKKFEDSNKAFEEMRQRNTALWENSKIQP